MSKHLEAKSKVDWLKIDDMIRDPEINVRPIDEKRAARIAADFDVDAIGTFSISHRATGQNVILDGQHRAEALRIIGWNGQKVPCVVYEGLTKQQESEKFITLNSQVAIRYLDRFMARISAKEKVACAIQEIVRASGYIIDRVSRDGVIVAVQSLEEVYLGKNQKIRGANPKALHGTLHAVTEAWGRVKMAVNSQVISGVGAFLLRYGDEIKLDRLIGKMKGINGGPQGLVNRGKGKRELHGGSIASGIGHYLTDEYNGGLRGSSRLLGWRD